MDYYFGGSLSGFVVLVVVGILIKLSNILLISKFFVWENKVKLILVVVILLFSRYF